MKATIYVRLKEDILDPQGKAVLNIVNSLGYININNIRINKCIEIESTEEDVTKFEECLE